MSGRAAKDIIRSRSLAVARVYVGASGDQQPCSSTSSVSTAIHSRVVHCKTRRQIKTAITTSVVPASIGSARANEEATAGASRENGKGLASASAGEWRNTNAKPRGAPDSDYGRIGIHASRHKDLVTPDIVTSNRVKHAEPRFLAITAAAPETEDPNALEVHVLLASSSSPLYWPGNAETGSGSSQPPEAVPITETQAIVTTRQPTASEDDARNPRSNKFIAPRYVLMIEGDPERLRLAALL